MELSNEDHALRRMLSAKRQHKGRTVVWFSCGAASAVAAKIICAKKPVDNIEVVYCDTMRN